MLTFNQDIELFNQFAIKHKGINDFRFGYELITGSNSSPLYPLMEVLPQGTTTNKGMIFRKYLIAISDLVNKDNSNENLVLSDCEQLCLDLPNYLRVVQNSGLLGAFKVNEDISLTDFTDRGTDTVAGYEFEITIGSMIGNSSCNLPINSGNILTNNYIYVGSNLAMTTTRTIETFSNFTGATITLTRSPLFIFMIDGDGLVIGQYTQSANIVTLTNQIDLPTTIRIVYEY